MCPGWTPVKLAGATRLELRPPAWYTAVHVNQDDAGCPMVQFTLTVGATLEQLKDGSEFESAAAATT
jgi:hypothetical protein